MIYWVTESIGTSFRPYYEGADQPAPMPAVEVPAAVFIQRHEGRYPESIARGYYRDLRGRPCGVERCEAATSQRPRSAALAERTRAFARDLGLL